MKRTAQKEQTRHQLLNMAYGKFAQNGFLATKTLDIAMAAGVSHGTLFVHFPTKEELLIKTIEEFGIRIGTKLKQLITDKGTAKEVLAAHLETIEEYESFYANLVIEGPLLPDSVRHRVFMIQSGIAHYLEKTIQASHNSAPIYFLLNSWLGLIHYYLTNRDLFAPGKSVIATCGRDLLNHFINTFHL
jgi:TetR/AcrR family transcriptional regulator, acrEF/envCD operon repressor